MTTLEYILECLAKVSFAILIAVGYCVALYAPATIYIDILLTKFSVTILVYAILHFIGYTLVNLYLCSLHFHGRHLILSTILLTFHTYGTMTVIVILYVIGYATLSHILSFIHCIAVSSAVTMMLYSE